MITIPSKISNISATVSKILSSFAHHHSFFESSFISPFFRLCHNTSPSYFVILKISFVIFFRVSKEILALAMHFTFYKVALIPTSIKFKHAFSCLFTLLEVAFIGKFALIPKLDPFTMLFFIFPHTFIEGSVFSIEKYPRAVCSTILVSTLMNIAIFVCKSTFAIILLIFGDSKVWGTIFVLDFSNALPGGPVSRPLAPIFTVLINFCIVIIPNEIFSVRLDELVIFLVAHDWCSPEALCISTDICRRWRFGIYKLSKKG